MGKEAAAKDLTLNLKHDKIDMMSYKATQLKVTYNIVKDNKPSLLKDIPNQVKTECQPSNNLASKPLPLLLESWKGA